MVDLKKSFWLLPLFSGFAFVFAAGYNSGLLWFLFYLSLGCVLLTLVYRWRRWTAIGITRSFNTDEVALEAGTDLRVNLDIDVFGFLPWPWLQAVDGLPRSLARHLEQLPASRLLWVRKRRARLDYDIPRLPRGIHVWDALHYESGDILGFLTYTGEVGQPARLVVYPRTVKLLPAKFFPHRVEGSLVPRKLFNLSQTQLVGVREYEPGDRLALIDWKTTAKAGHLHSKEYEPLLMSYSLVLLDCSLRSWGQGYDPAFEQAVIVAASLIRAATAANLPVRFRSNYSKQRGKTGVVNQSEYYGLLEYLAAIDHDGQASFTKILQQELSLRNSNVVIVTSPKADYGPLLRQLSARGNSVTSIFVTDEQEGAVHKNTSGFYTEMHITKAEDLIGGTRERKAN